MCVHIVPVFVATRKHVPVCVTLDLFVCSLVDDQSTCKTFVYMEAKFPQLQNLQVGFIIAFVVEMQHQH